MSAQSKMFDQLSFEDLPSVTSSPASADGPTLSDSQAGPTIDPFGLEAAHANLSARQAKEKGLLTSGICGPRSSGSFATNGPSRSLVNRLRVVTDSLGSTLYKLTWKRRTTPQGRSIYALRASVRRTSGKGFTGVPTPKTPTGGGMEDRTTPGGGLRKLEDACLQFSGVPTATARDYKDRYEQDVPTNALLGREVWKFSGVATPTAEDSSSNIHRNETSRNPGLNLNDHAATFQKDSPADSGKTPNGSAAETGSTGQLNPAYSRWLMAYPPEWDVCAVTAMQSLPRKPRSSSKRVKESA